VQFIVVSNCVKWSARCGQLHTLHTRAQVGCGLVTTRRLLSIMYRTWFDSRNYNCRRDVTVIITMSSSMYDKSVKSKPTVCWCIYCIRIYRAAKKIDGLDAHYYGATCSIVLFRINCTNGFDFSSGFSCRWYHTFCTRCHRGSKIFGELATT